MEQIRVLMTSGSVYYKGGLTTITPAGGLGVKAIDTAGHGHLCGIMSRKVDATLGAEYAALEIGRVWIPFAAAAQADVGDYVYATDDGTIAKTATNANPIGIAVDCRVGVALLVDLRKGIPKTALA